METVLHPPLFASLAAAQAALTPVWHWPHFSIAELACRCRGRFCKAEYWHAPEFLNALEALRAKVGSPLILNSGHRCAQWNALVGGAPVSMHKTIAADISLVGHERQVLREAARETGFTGLGLARSFLHVDRRKRPAHWYYHGSSELWET